MATTQEIQERIKAMARQLAEELGDVDESMGVCWLDAVENRAVEIGDALTAELTRQTTGNQTPQAEATCPNCQQSGRYKGPRERELMGRRGPVTISEPEFYCACCRKSFFPDDATLGR